MRSPSHGLKPSRAREFAEQSRRDSEQGERPPAQGQRQAHASVPSTSRYPSPHTFTTKRSPATDSFPRKRDASESSVRVMPMDLYPHTPRSSSSRVNTRVGS